MATNLEKFSNHSKMQPTTIAYILKARVNKHQNKERQEPHKINCGYSEWVEKKGNPYFEVLLIHAGPPPLWRDLEYPPKPPQLLCARGVAFFSATSTGTLFQLSLFIYYCFF